MKITLSKRIGLLAFLLPCALALSTTVHAETNKLVIESGDSAQSRQHAAMEKEQWNDCQRQDYWPFFAIFNVRYWSLMLSAFRHFIITDWRGVF
uniref:DUF1283 domain-containing protein n=1 Tax=Escherichia coli TaxID=562 RepID=UPI002447B3AF